MTREFAPYDRALKLKQLGFDEPCFLYWWKNESGYILADIIYDEVRTLDFKAPLFQQAFRWFREKYSLGHEISYPYSSTHFGKNVKIINEGKFEAFITDEEQLSFTDEDFLHDTYEEAELACLDKLIEIATKQQEQ
jgi:hypothetical protein